MKKLLSSILIMIYLTMSLGMTLTMHYCMGEISDMECGIADILHSCNQPKKEAHCCSTETQLIKLTSDQKEIQLSKIDFSPAKELLYFRQWIDSPFYNLPKQNEYITDNDNFLKERGTPLYLFHCLLLI